MHSRLPLRRIALLGLLFCIFFTHLQAQTVVQGRVLDTAQMPIANAQISAFASSTGAKKLIAFTHTDPRGKFSIKIAKPASIELVIAFLGYAPRSIPIPEDAEALLILPPHYPAR